MKADPSGAANSAEMRQHHRVSHGECGGGI